MKIVLGLSLLALSGCIWYIIQRKNNISQLTDQLNMFAEINTNQELTSAHLSFNALVIAINNNLRKSNQTQQKLRQNAQQFDQAIYNISHDLRTPLTVATGYAQYLKKNAHLPSEERQALLSKIHSNLAIVEQRLEDLLEYNRVAEQAITVELSACSVSRLLEEVILRYYQAFQSQHIDLSIQIDKQIEGIYDVQLLERIFQNTIGNILAHGSQKAAIQLQATEQGFSYHCGNYTEQPITDRQKLFERFYTEDLSRKNKNAGLGLYITKEFVQLLSGQIKLTGEEHWFQIEISLKNNTPLN